MARVTLAVVATALLAASPAAAKQKPITGTLSKGGYTVVALADNGRLTTAQGKKFRLVPPAKRFTLHLRDKKGSYAGPVVAPGARQTVVVTGFRAGAALGRITVKKGYAVTRKLGRRSLDSARTAIAKRGRPIGAGVLGLVKAKSSARSGAGLDSDRDGLPALFDIDDDGDLVLDNVDRPPVKAAFNYSTNYGSAVWMMNIGLQQSRLADQAGLAPGVGGYALNRDAAMPFGTEAGFETMVSLAMRVRGALLLLIPQAGTELDCTGLAYCTQGGKTTDMTQTKRFPDNFDPDGDGFGTMQPVGSFNPANDGIATIQQVDPAKVFGMKPGVGPLDIFGGQFLVMHSPTQGDSGAFINFVFQTVPALARWGSDVTGPAQNVLDYPISDGKAGSESNPAELQYSRADGEYWLQMSLWRPQRNTAGGWTDMGRLTYSVAGRTIGAGSRVWHCPASAYRLNPGVPADGYLTADGVYDGSADAAPDPNRMVSFWVDVSACQRASGVPVWTDGDQTASEVTVAATTEYGDAAEGVGFDFKPEQKPGTAGGGGGGGAPPAAPAVGTWNFAGDATRHSVAWTVHMNDANVTRLRIQFHEATPITGHTDPSGWTCATVTVSNPNDALECTSPSGQAAGTDVSGSLSLTSSGTDGMPVTLTVTENGVDTTSDMTQK